MAGAESSPSKVDLTFSFAASFKGARSALRVTYPWLHRLHLGVTIVFVGSGLLARDIVGIGYGVLYFVLLEVWIRLSLRPYWGNPFEEVWTISDQDVRMAIPDRSLTFRWESCRGVQLRRGCWVLRFSGFTNAGFPDDALTDAQTEDFIRLLRARSLLQ